jgi:lysophospholipase-3
MWPDSQPNVRTDDGDGTVNIRSLKGCLRWQGKQNQTVYHQQFKGAEHMEILENKDIISYLKTYLTN